MLKQLTRRGFIALFAALAVLVLGLCTFAPADAHAAEGWKVNTSKGFWYDYGNGKYAKGWVQDSDGDWFYFDKNGWAKEGWQKIGGKWYYLVGDPDFYYDNSEMSEAEYEQFLDELYSAGLLAQMKNGTWHCAPAMWNMGAAIIDGKVYYFKSSGAMHTGWLKEGSSWFYFAKSGALQTGWVKVSKKWYFMEDDGVMLTGWLNDGGKRYYLTSSGAMATGWQKVDGTWYYFNKSGAMQKGKWIGNYYVQDDGTMAVNKWIGKYHVDKNGKWDKTR